MDTKSYKLKRVRLSNKISEIGSVCSSQNCLGSQKSLNNRKISN